MIESSVRSSATTGYLRNIRRTLTWQASTFARYAYWHKYIVEEGRAVVWGLLKTVQTLKITKKRFRGRLF